MENNTVTTKRVTDLTENTDINDNDLFMAGTSGTASLRKIKWSTIIAKIKSKLIANNYTTTQEGYALDARKGKELKDQLDELNMNLTPTSLPLTKGAKFKNVTMGALRLGKLIIITIEGEPSSYVVTEDIVISGLPGARNGSWPVALATKDQNYSAVVDAGGNLKIWYPGYTAVSRIECTVMYIAA